MNRSNNYPSIQLLMLGIHYICLNLGQVISLGRFKLSYLSTILLVCVYLSSNGFKIRFPEDKRMRVMLNCSILWVIYAAIQIIAVNNYSLFFGSFFVLFTNAFTVCMSLLIIKEKEDVLFALDAFAVSFLLNILGAIYELFTGNVIIDTGNTYTEIMLGGFIGNFNDFCTFLFLGIVVFFIEIMFNKSKLIKAFFLLAIIISVYMIFWNGARGGIYSLYILLALWPVFFVLRKLVKKKTKYNRFIVALWVLISIAVVVFVIVYGFYNALALLDRSGGGDIGSDRARVRIILGCVKAFFDSFGFGIGAGQSQLIQTSGINPHNFYAEIFSEYGLLAGAFATYLSFFVFVIRSHKIDDKLESLLEAAGYAFLIANVTSSSINKMRALWIYFVLIYIIKKTDMFNELTCKNVQNSKRYATKYHFRVKGICG